jgi:IS1 family transposase
LHSPYDVSAKHAFLGTHLHLSMPFREMLLTRQSVLTSLLPTTFRVPDIPERTTCPSGPFVHSIVKLSRRTHGYHYQTNHIERFNNTLRQRVSRLVRSALSFSKKLSNHIGAIKYFICNYNLLKAKA